MTCPSCGKEVTEGVFFCSWCGRVVSQVEEDSARSKRPARQDINHLRTMVVATAAFLIIISINTNDSNSAAATSVPLVFWIVLVCVLAAAAYKFLIKK